MIELFPEAVAMFDLEALRPYARDNTEFNARPGTEHYRLLAYLSLQFLGRTLVDIGSHRGASALALSFNGSNRVESFDVVDNVPEVVRQRENIRFHQEDLFDPDVRAKWKETLLGSAIVFIDVDPHDGAREHELVQWLLAEGYGGLIVLDDIWFFRGMRNELWYRLPESIKVDVTSIGHWSGTGIVCQAPQGPPKLRGAPSWNSLRNWTLVTGYFDLTGLPDASPAIQQRPAAHYLDQNAHSTLALDANLIVFCEPQQKDRIMALRPRHLHERTRVITMSFEDFPLTRYRDQIIENRNGPWCARDPRNTASYYLFCMARYAMLKQAIADNQFGSTRFAWINICIERMGFKNLIRLPEALAVQRERFSTCYIDYVSQSVRRDLSQYFGPNGCRDCQSRCTMCSGFFTGSTEHMKAVCDAMEAQFVRCVDAGYGHSDEQIMNLVHLDHPELFDWYCGDYAEMITNYAHVYERAEQPVVNLIRNSLLSNDWEVCTRACAIVWDSYISGRCTLDDGALKLLLSARSICSIEAGR